MAAGGDVTAREFVAMIEGHSEVVEARRLQADHTSLRVYWAILRDNGCALEKSR